MMSLARPPGEMANVVIHGLGLTLGIAGAAYLLSVVGDILRHDHHLWCLLPDAAARVRQFDALSRLS